MTFRQAEMLKILLLNKIRKSIERGQFNDAYFVREFPDIVELIETEIENKEEHNEMA